MHRTVSSPPAPAAAGLRLIVLVLVAGVSAGAREPLVIAALVAAGVVAAAGARPRRRHIVPALLGLSSGALTALGIALVGDPALALAVGLRLAAAVLWTAWFAASVHWASLKVGLRRTRVPGPVLDAVDAALAHGQLLLAALVRRRQAALARHALAPGRPHLATHAAILAGGVELALDRALVLEEARALRAAPPGAGAAAHVAVAPGPLLVFDHVSVTRDDGAPRLEQVSLALIPGEWVALIGASGSGKSTLLRVASGLLPPSHGALWRFGRDLGPARGARRIDGRAGLVFQEPDDQLFGATPREDVAWGLRARGLSDPDAEARAREALASLASAELADRPVHRLSFGERKRVAMAAILACEPELLLCDEPTAGLDPVTSRKLVQTVELAAQGRRMAVLWATHDLQALPARVHRVVLLGRGRVVFDGPRAQALSAEVLARAGMYLEEPT